MSGLIPLTRPERSLPQAQDRAVAPLKPRDGPVSLPTPISDSLSTDSSDSQAENKLDQATKVYALKTNSQYQYMSPTTSSAQSSTNTNGKTSTTKERTSYRVYKQIDVSRYRTNYKLKSKYRTFLKDHDIFEFINKFVPSVATKSDIFKLAVDMGYHKKYFGDVESLSTRELVHRLLYRIVEDSTLVSALPQLPVVEYSLDQFLDNLKNCNNIMIITGAGISTSLGIPDFRSFKGLYTQLSHLNLNDPQEAFNMEVFQRNPDIFFSIAHLILPPEEKYAIFHSFIGLLQSKGKLLRNYTQNIDNLEKRVGIHNDKLVQCHGSFGTATCITCHKKYNGTKIFSHIKHKQVPRCLHCFNKVDMNDEIAVSYGVIKPDITFFGEALPEIYHSSIKKDILNCDLAIVAGTSLQVEPVASIIEKLPLGVPRVLINKDDLPEKRFDLRLLGDSDVIAAYISQLLGETWEIQNSFCPQAKKPVALADEFYPNTYRIVT